MSTTMFYGAYQFLPAPLMNKTIEYTYDAQGLVFIGNTYTLNGYLLFPSGDFGEMMTRRAALEAALASGNQLFQIQHNSVPVISCYPTVNNVTFDEGVWVQKIPYSIELYEKTSSASISGIESYSESWSFSEEDNNETIHVEHSVNAKGINTAGSGADNSLENAKTYVLNNTGYSSVPVFLPSFCKGSGTLNAYESYRTENANENDGTYEITEIFTLSSGVYQHTLTSNFSTDDTGAVTVTVDGSVQGLGRGTTKFTNALIGWNDVKSRIINTASGVYLRYGGTLNIPFNPNTYSIAENSYLGTIEYSYTYIDSFISLPSGILEFEITKDIDEPVGLYASHAIINKIDGNIIQDLGTATEGTITISGRAVKKPDYPLADLKDYIETRITALAPTGYATTYRVTQKSYSKDDTENVIEFSISWAFTAPAYSSYLTYLNT